MQKLITLSARSIAGLIYSGKLNRTQVTQFYEECGYEDKLELVDALLEDMGHIDSYYNAKDSQGYYK